ncbi:MAG: hypothetical protein Q8P13_01105 [bacterium]|nr:hypothetical protein [bacterium]
MPSELPGGPILIVYVAAAAFMVAGLIWNLKWRKKKRSEADDAFMIAHRLAAANPNLNRYQREANYFRFTAMVLEGRGSAVVSEHIGYILEALENGPQLVAQGGGTP